MWLARFGAKILKHLYNMLFSLQNMWETVGNKYYEPETFEIHFISSQKCIYFKENYETKNEKNKKFIVQWAKKAYA